MGTLIDETEEQITRKVIITEYQEPMSLDDAILELIEKRKLNLNLGNAIRSSFQATKLPTREAILSLIDAIQALDKEIVRLKAEDHRRGGKLINLNS